VTAPISVRSCYAREMLRMSAAEIEQFLTEHFPAAVGFARIEELRPSALRLRVPYRDEFLRPGGTLSGPTLMTLADTAIYFLILAHLGPVGLAVTSNLAINFLRKPAARDLIGEARLLKLGKRTAVGDVLMFVDGEPEPVAHATASYALPSR
jgi:uncharacterized protein (TIGR00369 family)